MEKPRNELWIFLGIIGGLALLGIAAFFVISALVRQAAIDALSPVTQINNNLQTRIAEIANPTPTILADPMTIIHDVRSLARLETIQYTLEKVITAEQGQDELAFLFGDRLLFVGHGKVIAGVDLSRVRPQDMWVDHEVLYFRMPPAEVFIATLDNDKSYVYDRNTGILTKGSTDLETNARKAAEQEILKAAMEDGILVQAQQNAESYLSRMLRGLGFADVIFVTDNTLPPAQTTPQP